MSDDRADPSALRLALGFLLGWLVRVWALTWRVRIYWAEPALLLDPQPIVFGFWHGTQMPLVAARRRRLTNVLVSWSQDGTLQAGVMRALGLGVVRGSSSRGGAAGLRAVVRRSRSGEDAAFAVDGPRGPLGVAKPGALITARLGGARCVPMGTAVSACWTLKRAWDQFSIPLPFARVSLVLGPALRTDADPVELSRAIDAANEHARACLARVRASRLNEEEPCPRS